MIYYRVSTKHSAAEFEDFADALSLYKSQRARGVAPVFCAIDGVLTDGQNKAIDLANHEADQERRSEPRHTTT